MELFASMISIFQKGGIVMVPLLACSVIAVAIAVERWIYYRQSQVDVDHFLSSLRSMLDGGKWAEAAAVCENSPAAVARVLAVGLNRLSRHSGGLENLLEGTAALEAAKLRSRLDYLGTIVTLAPLLGLLGTVIGMIHSFSIMNIRSGQPQVITGGVGEALIATATGLCVAILALIIHSWFKHRLDSVVTDMEQACTYLLDRADRGPDNETA